MLNVKELAKYLASCSAYDLGQYVWPDYGDGDRWFELNSEDLEKAIQDWVDEHCND